jgi:M6 family metalloprotease-like protein
MKRTRSINIRVVCADLLLATAALAAVMCARAYGEPVAGEVFPVKQPDGTLIQVRVWGDEFYRVVESLDGYTLVRDPASGAACYARLSGDGNELISTGVPAEAAPPAGAGLAPHIRISPAFAKAKIAANRAVAAAGEAEARAAMVSRGAMRLQPACGGAVRGIVLLVDFSDEPWTIPPANVDNYCNQVGYTGYGNNGSIRDYFSDVSDGNLTYTNFVPTAYYRAAHPKTYYEDPGISFGYRGRELVLEALADLDDQGFDFSQYDSNGDGYVDAVNCFYAGYRGSVWAEGLWPHSWVVNFSADGVQTYKYQITDLQNSLTLRTFCHENGHMLCYWPDLYDYDPPGPEDSAGVGKFCIMCAGTSSTNPQQPCAYMKYISGWATTTILATPQTGLSVPSDFNAVYKYEHPSLANEYYLIENRQQTGRDSGLPDAGLAIWHVDEFGSNDLQDMTFARHYLVTLVQADGNWDLEHNVNIGDSTDLWSSPGYTECTSDSYPNTNWWNGSASNLFVTGISASGAVMTFDFGFNPDCNDNGLLDACDVDCTAMGGTCVLPGCGLSRDCNADGIPDECEPLVPDMPLADPSGIAKSRFISLSIPQVGSNGEQAVQVLLTSLHHPEPPYTNGPSIPFVAFENLARWVGPPTQYRESSSAPTTFMAATLQCTPHYQDWSTVGLLHVTGEEIVPSSLYDAFVLDGSCRGNEANCLAVSCPLTMYTTRWGDVVVNDVADFADISALVSKYQNKAGAPIKARSKIATTNTRGLINIALDVGFADISACVSAYQGKPYPYKPGKCSGAPATACKEDADCGGAPGSCILCP